MHSAQFKLVQRKTNGQLANVSGLPPLLRRIYAARGVSSADEVDFSLRRLAPCDGLPGIDRAAKLLEQALRDQSRVLIVGDYDADGTTGTAVLYRALRLFGFENVDYIVPDRFRFGYGLSPELVETAVKEKQSDLIITVDNGISSIDGIECAKRHGIITVITDHHLPPAVLPDADAVVNPNLPESTFPSKVLAGVGVAFYTMIALRKHLHQQGLLTEPPRIDFLLDLVAVGTVADLVPLDANNRILVEQGLRRIRQGCGNYGIQALFKIAKRAPAKAISSDLAFAIGPRLNAAGRLEDTAAGIACLLSDKPEQASFYAQALDEINQRRREMTEQMQQDAWDVLSDEDTSVCSNSLCLFSPTWHEGIVGLVASRLKESLHRPIIAFAQTQEDGELKGSARSIAEVHIRDLLERIADKHPDLMTNFGGHALAAGVSMPESNFQLFKELFEEEVYACLDAQTLDNLLLSDGELHDNEITYKTAKQLATACPWGQGFPEPLFDGVFEILETRLLAGRHLGLKLKKGSGSVKAIFFNIVNGDESTSQQYDLVMNADKIRIAYHLHADEYKGRCAPILKVQYIEAA